MVRVSKLQAIVLTVVAVVAMVVGAVVWQVVGGAWTSYRQMQQNVAGAVQLLNYNLANGKLVLPESMRPAVAAAPARPAPAPERPASAPSPSLPAE